MDYFDDAYFGDYFDTDEAEVTGSARKALPQPRRLAAPVVIDPDADEAYLGVL